MRNSQSANGRGDQDCFLLLPARSLPEVASILLWPEPHKEWQQKHKGKKRRFFHICSKGFWFSVSYF
jgi:hypothetical protein